MMSSETLVLPTSYLPPAGWMAAICAAQTVILEAHETYQKGGWRNRCVIAGPNGPQMLSIPLEKGKHQQTPVREVRTDNSVNWQKIHWRSIKTAYGNAPFFEYYSDDLAVFFEKKTTFLFDFNLELLQFLIKKFGWKNEIHLSESYQGKIVLPSIDIPSYPQVFHEKHGFLPGLSSMDVLMCRGKNAFGN